MINLFSYLLEVGLISTLLTHRSTTQSFSLFHQWGSATQCDNKDDYNIGLLGGQFDSQNYRFHEVSEVQNKKLQKLVGNDL